MTTPRQLPQIIVRLASSRKMRGDSICVNSIIIEFAYIVGANKNTEKGGKIQKTPSPKNVPDASSFVFACFWFVS
jgi:hypothetical protein